MDKSQEFTFLTYTHQTLPPAQLWIGNHESALKEVEHFLQKMLCKSNGCNTCVACMQIREKQHHALMWLHPEKNYTIDQLEDLFATLTLQLQPDELFFFIIQKADFLTAACANKLLKSIEEPPRGYHFILLAERADLILPTIRSRCAVYALNSQPSAHDSHPIYECFTKKLVAPDEFSKIVDTAATNERESVELLDAILCYWLTQYNKNSNTHRARPELVEGCPRALEETLLPQFSFHSKPGTPSKETEDGDKTVQGERGKNNLVTITSIINSLEQAHLRPPMPGSSIIFWRNLYLQLYKNLSTILT